jgi:prevent-host-death family protein
MKRRIQPQVGVRELRQNLSVYLRQVQEDGTSYEVTDRGRPVARLTPMTDRPLSIYEQMVADGRIAPAKARWEDLPPPLPSRSTTSLSQAIIEQREEEDW